MPDIDFDRDFDFDHDGTPGYDNDDHGFFGHGGFVNYNHFERSEFFSTPSRTKGGNTKGLYKFLAYVVYFGLVVLIGLITWFILFS